MEPSIYYYLAQLMDLLDFSEGLKRLPKPESSSLLIYSLLTQSELFRNIALYYCIPINNK